MVYDSFPFNPLCDKNPVSSTGFVDLKSAFVNNAIPSNISNEDSDYNGIDDPASILGKPSDIFEAMEMESHISNFTPSTRSDESED